MLLPARMGARPRTTPSNPHTQLDQQPTDSQPGRRLRELLDHLEGVRWSASLISVPGARALTLDQDNARGPGDAFMAGTEFAHLHPDPDHSLHMVLPPEEAQVAINAGWAEQHPVARLGMVSAGAVMVYAPRDLTEADVVAELVRASYAYARGELPQAR